MGSRVGNEWRLMGAEEGQERVWRSSNWPLARKSRRQHIATHRNPQPTPPHRSRGPEDGIFGWPDERREGIGKGKGKGKGPNHQTANPTISLL